MQANNEVFRFLQIIMIVLKVNGKYTSRFQEFDLTFILPPVDKDFIRSWGVAHVLVGLSLICG